MPTDYLIEISSVWLSDGFVYSVHVHRQHCADVLEFVCTSREAAEKFAAVVNDAINSNWTRNTSEIAS